MEENADRPWLERFADSYTLVSRVFLGIVLLVIGMWMLATGNMLALAAGLGVLALAVWCLTGLLRRKFAAEAGFARLRSLRLGREINSKKVVMACAQREPDFLRKLGSCSRDDLAQRREQRAQLRALPGRLLVPPEQRRELSARNAVALDACLRQLVDAPLDAKALRVELERTRVAVRHGRFHLTSRKRRTFGHCVGERLDTLQEFPVVGHQ